MIFLQQKLLQKVWHSSCHHFRRQNYLPIKHQYHKINLANLNRFLEQVNSYMRYLSFISTLTRHRFFPLDLLAQPGNWKVRLTT